MPKSKHINTDSNNESKIEDVQNMVTLKRKYNYPQKEYNKILKVKNVNEVTSKIVNYPYNGKVYKLIVEATLHSTKEYEKFKKLVFTDVVVKECNGKTISNFYSLKSDIQGCVAAYVGKWFNLPERIANIICYMNNFQDKENKLTLALWKNDTKKINCEEDPIGKKFTFTMKISRIGITAKKDDDSTAIVFLNYEILTDINALSVDVKESDLINDGDLPETPKSSDTEIL